jgi:hypothetical protein
MNRSSKLLTILAWSAGTLIPALLAIVFLFGCCALPFHRVVHRYLPLCGGIVKLLATAPPANAGAPTPTTAPPAKVRAVRANTAVTVTAEARTASSERQPRPSLRSWITLGALRCDRDVGWHVLLAVFLI